MKIAFIGAGSIGFCRQIFTDIMTVPELRDSEIVFMDINATNLDMVRELCQRDVDANGIDLKIRATTDRREALKDADFVINSVRIGGLEAFETDVEIPLKYGVDQCVGDTLCIGGIMYGQRVIAMMLDMCRDIREVAKPDVVHLSHSNPNAMVTWACNHYGKVNTIGLCHGEIHGEEQIAEILGYDRSELDFICAGLNHQTWYLSVKHNGKELRHTLLDAFLKHEVYSQEEKVRIDMLRRFGYYSTESNGHLSEYVPWYRKRTADIPKWIQMGSWINGETCGYLRICKESRNWFETDYPNWLKEPPWTYDGSNRSVEHTSHIIEAMKTRRIYRGTLNVINHHCIENLPPDCIVEVPCYIDGNGVSVPRIGNLPAGCAAVLGQSVAVQRLAVEAAVSGDDVLLRQAALLDPLTGAVCDPEEVWQMVDEMLIAQKRWLPQYADAIAAAEQRWAEKEKAGTLIPPKPYTGSTRQKTRTIEELSEHTEAMRHMVSKAAKEKVNV
ncbi:MAG: alpha-glucosidase/alpha-galactosidase [Planctomycetes bacterium]|nr:alpha-glucosidase/alpha-galactosidase [Planctomycetota bacterium]